MRNLILVFVLILTGCASLGKNVVEYSVNEGGNQRLAKVVTGFVINQYPDKEKHVFVLNKDGNRLSDILWVKLRALGYQVRYGEYGKSFEGTKTPMRYIVGKYSNELVFSSIIGSSELQQTFKATASGNLRATSPLSVMSINGQGEGT